jgi:glycosyltransferase involved in cell wall biosynthesis
MSAPFITVEENGEVIGILFLKKQRLPPKLQLEAKHFGRNVTFRVYDGEGREIAMVNGVADLPLTLQEPEKTFTTVRFTSKKRLLPKEKRDNLEAVTLISTFNEQCGIATYSHFLTEALMGLGKTVYVCRYLWDAKIPSIIHSQIEFGIFPKVNMVAGSNPALKNCGKIATWHTVFREPKKVGLTEYIEAVDKEYDVHIVHNSLAKKWLLPYTSKPIYIIPHGTVLWQHSGKKEARQKLGLPLDGQILFAFGFSADSKGFSELAQLTVKLRQSYPRLILVVSGAVHGIAQKESSEALEKVKTIHNEGVIVLGRYLSEEEVNNYAEASDILIFNYYDPDYVASASGAIHRVLNAGAPIVCSDSNRTIELQDGVHCLKYPMGDIESLQASIETLLEEHDLAEELGKNAKLLAEATSWKRVALQHIQVYESITKGEELFGPEWYDRDYFDTGKKTYLTPNGQIKQWGYLESSTKNWLGWKEIIEGIIQLFNLSPNHSCKQSHILSPTVILDAGTGCGGFVHFGRKAGLEVWGFDFSEYACKHAFGEAKKYMVKADARYIPFKDKSFHLVTALDLLEHIYEQDLDKVVSELQRVCIGSIFYLIGATMSEDDEHFTLRKGEIPPVKWQATAIAGHVNVRPCERYWKKKLVNDEWVLRDDLVEKFRELVPKNVLANWQCIIIVSHNG